MQHMLSLWRCKCQKKPNSRSFSSIFDVVRERRKALSNVDTTDAPTPGDVTESRPQQDNPEGSGVTHIWKQFSILRSKPKGYRDPWQLRYLGVRTLQLLPITSAEELSRIAEVLAYVKYRNVVLLQGVSEALHWHCKLGKCKLRDLTCFLRSCATLKFVPSYRHLELFVAELDNAHNKPSVGDYLRILQFLVGSISLEYQTIQVENGLSSGDVFMDVYARCYNHCLQNLGYMTHQHLSSFSQTQLLIDNTDGEVFDRICLNFERDLNESGYDHFLMLSNALLRSGTNDLSVHYSRLLGHYLRSPEGWHPQLINAVLRVLAKYYHRDMVALSKLGNIIVKNIAAFTPDQAYMVLNLYSALSYKHKELLHGIMNSHLIGVSNLLAKVEYKHISIMKSITEHTINSLKAFNGGMPIPSSTAGLGEGINKPVALKVPWIVYERQKCRIYQEGNHAFSHCPKNVLTGDMILDSIAAPLKDANSSPKLRKSTGKSVRRLIWISKHEQESGNAATTDISRLKVVPVSVDVMRRQSLKECLQEFYNDHFHGKHPAWRRLYTRKRMHWQTRQLYLRKGFDRSSTLPSVHLEKFSRFKVNRSVRKVKKKMRYAGSRYVQSTQHYINECRVLKRCFLRPYKTIADAPTTGCGPTDVNCDAVTRLGSDTRQILLADVWGKYSRACLHRSSIANSFTETINEPHRGIDAATQAQPDAHLVIQNGTDRYSSTSLTSSDVSGSLSGRPPRQSLVLQQLEGYVDSTSPVFVDNALLFQPLEVSSLFSWRLKRKLWSLKRAHEKNDMSATISYMLSNGFWRRYERACEIQTPTEQPLWRYMFEIVSALHKLNFSSFELLNQATMALDHAEPLSLDLNSSHMNKSNTKEMFNVLLKTVKRFGYTVSAVSPILSRDASGIIATRLLSSICSSNMLKLLEICTLRQGIHLTVTDATGIIRRFNSLVFYKYGRRQLPCSQIGKREGTSVLSDDAISFTQAETQIMTAYESLHALAKCSISGDDIGKDVMPGTVETHAVHLMQFLNEVVYSSWIASRLSRERSCPTKSEYISLLPPEAIAYRLLSCMEKGSNREVGLYGLCAIRRYLMLQSCIAPLNGACDVDSDNYGATVAANSENIPVWSLRLQNLMERYGFVEDTLDTAIYSKYDGTRSVVSMPRRNAGGMRSDVMTAEAPADARTTAAGILHDFYLNHYIVF
ncbi:hypothetical protein X943_002829 [Babesia divergens]|uniref:Uncharacterized protein n=1 Tax=Babesia divergens TaxID=32595 RepID=A0AAD9LHB3_BABDI|nr:hypothetical protein X943_002829 [Babesia divergens]